MTLTEIMIVVMVIGVLVSIAVPMYSNARNNARLAKARHDVSILHASIRQLLWDTGEFPKHYVRTMGTPPNPLECEDLTLAEAGLMRTDNLFNNWKGPYLGKIEKDPWGMNYFFDPDYFATGYGVSYIQVVGSYGPNKVGRNVYDSDNIYERVE